MRERERERVKNNFFLNACLIIIRDLKRENNLQIKFFISHWMQNYNIKMHVNIYIYIYNEDKYFARNLFLKKDFEKNIIIILFIYLFIWAKKWINCNYILLISQIQLIKRNLSLYLQISLIFLRAI